MVFEFFKVRPDNRANFDRSFTRALQNFADFNTLTKSFTGLSASSKLGPTARTDIFGNFAGFKFQGKQVLTGGPFGKNRVVEGSFFGIPLGFNENPELFSVDERGLITDAPPVGNGGDVGGGGPGGSIGD